MRHVQALERLSRWDRALSLRFNRMSRRRWMRLLFGTVSRLGDGALWYALWLALLLRFGAAAVPAVVHMVAAGLLCTAVYGRIKACTVRPRPYQAHPDITLLATPLDQFSFPSGHTLHAVAFSVIATAYYPWLAWLVVPFTLLVAASRVFLGLHYPSDVLAGAMIGATLAAVSLLVI